MKSRKPVFCLSPCGTSLLTNGVDDKTRPLIFKYANHPEKKSIPTDDLKLLQNRITTVERAIMQANPQEAKRMSAELNGIITYYENDLSRVKQDHHTLLSTDTWLGNETAKLVKLWLERHGFNVQVHRQNDLNTKELANFQLALSDFVHEFADTLEGYRENNYHVVFNLTGGFKSVQGFLQTLAQFYADETIYIFESGGELLRIPRLPIQLHAESIIKKHLDTFRRLSNNFPVNISEVQDIPETLLLQMDGEVTLSEWGQVIWEKNKLFFYEESVLQPVSDKIRFSKRFSKDVNKLAPNRKNELNRKIDMLSKVFKLGHKYNLSTLDFKTLTGNPIPGITHEFDAWHDDDGKRVFGYFDGDVFVLDKFEKGIDH